MRVPEDTFEALRLVRLAPFPEKLPAVAVPLILAVVPENVPAVAVPEMFR